MKETNKWSVRDVITTVLLSAVLIVISSLSTYSAWPATFSMVLSVGITVPLRAGLYAHGQPDRRKRFVTLIYMALLGDFPADGQLVFAPLFIVTGVLCGRFCGSAGACGNPKRMTAAWTVASLLYSGVNLLPIWFFWDTYYDFALASSCGAELH